jgi:hypothetical protein
VRTRGGRSSYSLPFWMARLIHSSVAMPHSQGGARSALPPGRLLCLPAIASFSCSRPYVGCSLLVLHSCAHSKPTELPFLMALFL